MVVMVGCIPYKLQETPRVSGVVRREADQQPVANARLHYPEYRKESVATSADGAFDFPPVFRWRMVPLAPLDRFGNVRLLVEAPGFQRAELSFQPGGFDLTNQTVWLQR
jgi:hypothetical protein